MYEYNKITFKLVTYRRAHLGSYNGRYVGIYNYVDTIGMILCITLFCFSTFVKQLMSNHVSNNYNGEIYFMTAVYLFSYAICNVFNLL